MINKLYTSISWPISAHPPVAAESRAHAPAGALITEPKELEVEIDCDWVEADWRAGIKPDDSTMSTRELITPNVYRRHHQQYNTLNMKWIDSSTQLSFFFFFKLFSEIIESFSLNRQFLLLRMLRTSLHFLLNFKEIVEFESKERSYCSIGLNDTWVLSW